MSWLVQKDVDEGRSKINFSEWNTAGTAQNERERKKASEVNEVILKGEMPPFIYLIQHPKAKLSQAEAQQLAQGLEITLGTATHLTSEK